MQTKRFSKNDERFICANCGKEVPPLSYTSRDHCPFCLASLHVDVFPGDRKNSCKGVMLPVDIAYTNNKGYVINYKCTKCGELHNNKTAQDDDFEVILSVMNKTYHK